MWAGALSPAASPRAPCAAQISGYAGASGVDEAARVVGASRAVYVGYNNAHILRRRRPRKAATAYAAGRVARRATSGDGRPTLRTCSASTCFFRALSECGGLPRSAGWCVVPTAACVRLVSSAVLSESLCSAPSRCAACSPQSVRRPKRTPQHRAAAPALRARGCPGLVRSKA